MDGATGVTQCVIPEGRSFTYKFRIDPEQHGTYWYHAHSAVKRADGLYGGLVVHRPADERTGHSDLSRHDYDAEKLLLVGDWYHRGADTVLGEYKNYRNFAYEPVPDSLLINGVGSYNCSNARPARPIDCVETSPPTLSVAADKAVRLRIVNTGAAAGLSFQLQNGTVQLLTVDGGGYASGDTPRTPTIGVLYPGERMDVLLLPSDVPADEGHLLDTEIKMVLDAELMPMKNWALTRIQDFPLKWRRRSSTTTHERQHIPESVDVFNVKDARGVAVPRDSGVRQEPAETALLYTSLAINNFKHDEPWGEVNHTSWVWRDPTAKPLLALERDRWADGTEQANNLRTFHAPWFRDGQGRWIDLVVNNVDDKGHPFHLHGYAFHVIGARQLDLGRSYNPYEPGATEREAAFFDTETPLLKDTVYVQSHGYVVLRFPLDNVGVWLMHCHVLWHQAVGMAPQQASPASSISEQPTLSSAPHGHTPTEQERQIFHLLRTLTVRQVNGGIKPDFWSKNLLQATYVYPAIWHAALALAAMYQRANILRDFGDASVAEQYNTFALQQHIISFRFIIAMNHSRVSGAEQEMLLTASALYAGICLLRADLNQARAHAAGAAKLSKQWRFLDDETEQQVADGVIGRANTRQLIRDVYHSFHSIASFSEDIAAHFEAPVWHVTEPFASVDEAYYAYLNIHSGWARIKSWEPDNRPCRGASPSPGQMQVRQHALGLWTIRFEAYLQLGTYTKEDLDTIELLRLFCLFEETFDTIMIHRTPEVWIKNSHRWERIVKAAERLLEKQRSSGDATFSTRGVFYYSLSVQEVLRLTGFICRSGAIRRRIIKLLQQWRHCDGLWDNEISWKLVEAKMLMEEEALAADRSASCECVPDVFFCMDHRVAYVKMELPEEGGLGAHMKTGKQLKQGLPGQRWWIQLRR
ncbi:ferro-O2-oxidoreductase [Cordyceps fumosorosea ARSEF 2679]|uniref:Ferro-O2-oxidoreductase n=1 Tax=Cordyceps fumosorosea (strain ARSEF 2679) TaxID=1081104 RepID=A0A167LQ29_CORFA|nr:ferro-O2-oxidoreductase [Cordyceps fumosorosea ARSEF 2679]OAA53357.1 ferro-O2-oxidoreductase [Cordyceps fumosorosea ARSEF 2679]